jgi:hypothetical protein
MESGKSSALLDGTILELACSRGWSLHESSEASKTPQRCAGGVDAAASCHEFFSRSRGSKMCSEAALIALFQGSTKTRVDCSLRNNKRQMEARGESEGVRQAHRRGVERSKGCEESKGRRKPRGECGDA